MQSSALLDMQEAAEVYVVGILLFQRLTLLTPLSQYIILVVYLDYNSGSGFTFLKQLKQEQQDYATTFSRSTPTRTNALTALSSRAYGILARLERQSS
jgi:hypothetical protein